MPESFAFYDLDLSSWKTSQRSLLLDLNEFSVTWPKAGMMRNGHCYPLPTVAHRKPEKDCSFWPTPRARDWMGTSKKWAGRQDKDLASYLGGIPNPLFVEWLMGFPGGWCEIPSEALEILSSPRSPNSSEGES